MLGIATSYSIDLTDLEYSIDAHTIRCRIKTEPEISGRMQGLIESMLKKFLPYLELNGDSLEVNIEHSKAGNILEDLRVENDTITLNINLKGLIS